MVVEEARAPFEDSANCRRHSQQRSGGRERERGGGDNGWRKKDQIGPNSRARGDLFGRCPGSTLLRAEKGLRMRILMAV